MEVSLDFETRSACDLKRAGAHKYAQHPTTDVWCAAFSIDGAAPALWAPDNEEEWTLRELAADPTVTWRAWNAQFERVIWRHVMVERYGFPDIPVERWVCTAAEARAMNLPGKLEGTARVLGIEEQKDMVGHRLMLQMARPRKINADGTIVWWDDAERKQRLFDYCKQDVMTEMGCKAMLQRLSDYEMNVWRLDQRANDHGVRLDVDTAEAAKAISDRVKRKADDELSVITGGTVSKTTNVGRLKDWMRVAFGIDVASLNKKMLRELLDDEYLPLPVREALEVRVATGKSSVRKIEAMLKAVCEDGYIRGMLLYHGAGTGRWAGRLVQPQNFPARTAGVPEWWIDGFFDAPEPIMRAIYQQDLDALNLEGSPLEVISMVLRSLLIASPGRALVAADYSAIEARVAAWLVGCAWRLEVFRTHGKIYEASAAMMFHLTMDQVTRPIRQKGKVAELALGFQGGENALITMGAYDMGLEDDELGPIKDAWRAASPEFPAGWRDLNDACIDAVRHPGAITEALGGRVRFKVSGGFLWLKLPSGRRLAYCQPKLVWKPAPWDKQKLIPGVEAWAVNSKTKQWNRRSLYGGLLFENVVQATARDLMADAMLRLDAGGKYQPLLSVHDEIICECDEATADARELEALMSELPAWAAGCPVKAEGWAGRRYRK